MKKYLLTVTLLFLLASCEQNIKFNNPAFQGLKDKQFWRATNFNATLNDSEELVIEGSLGYEKMQLNLNSIELGTYVLGEGAAVFAEFSTSEKEKEMFYTTAAALASGKIVITNYDLVQQTISGTFIFYALAQNIDVPEEAKAVHLQFTEGVFYKVPISKAADNQN
ncbi:DUF6252 family protein [Flavobacterium sp. TAB 87]|uniref:DUF6252 family protein n=1 Tax=Flavobacterium sp. TAB 87 TaxID=1729581 RepID=UPI00076CFA72|nr:DUF6252 family protein [Flavobacterium sp. TAB 87]KVV13684.1 hypothetical protein AP058_03049 [Flavobacterium sp. TAB 87]